MACQSLSTLSWRRLRRKWSCWTASIREPACTHLCTSPVQQAAQLSRFFRPLGQAPCSEAPLPCRLYVNVITTIRSFGDYFWVDVVEQIDAMTEQVSIDDSGQTA